MLLLLMSTFSFIDIVEKMCTPGGFGESGPDSPSLSVTREWGGPPGGPPAGQQGPQPGGGPVLGVVFSLHPSPGFRLSVSGQISAKKSRGGGSHGASINPRWGGTPPLVAFLHGFDWKA